MDHALQLLEPRFPRVADQLRVAEADVLAHLSYPMDHWGSISSTNAIERLNAEIDRRARVVGIFLRCQPAAAHHPPPATLGAPACVAPEVVPKLHSRSRRRNARRSSAGPGGEEQRRVWQSARASSCAA